MRNGYFWLISLVLILIPVYPARLLNIHVGYEVGTLFFIGCIVFIYLIPSKVVRFIRKISFIDKIKE